MDIPIVLQNAVRIIKEDLYLVSAHRHDFKTHVFDEVDPSNGRRLEISVDGGVGKDGYIRRVGALYDTNVLGLYEEYSLTESDPFDLIAVRLLWGTLGPKGDQSLKYRPIRELQKDHLQSILDNCFVGDWHNKVIRFWLSCRNQNEIHVSLR